MNRSPNSLRAAKPKPTILAVATALAFAEFALAAQPGVVLPPGVLPSLKGITYGSGAARGADITVTPKTFTPEFLKSRGVSPGRTNGLLIDQQANQKAILEWNSFNIGSGSTVYFKQQNQGSVALNYIRDADPSIIQGALIADGQVYLINQNGVLFDRGAQINLHTLVASTLNMSQDAFLNGVKFNTDAAAKLFEGVSGDSRIDIGLYGPDGAPAPVIQTASGGAIVMLAPNVTNNGILKAPDGQVILAAGSKALLFQPADQNSAQMRGFFVEVTADRQPVNVSSLVSNLGEISADRGNVTLAALAINQSGHISAKQAVNRNGSVWLIGRDKTTLSANSVIETPLDTTDRTTLANDQAYSTYRPSVIVEGNTIVDNGTIRSPAGNISLSTFSAASADPVHNSAVVATGGESGGPARIFLGADAVIDASGVWAQLPQSKATVSFKVTTNDLKDTPLQKGGILLGKTVTVDIEQGSSLFDVSGYVDSIPRTVAEKSTVGGDVSLLSTGDVILSKGSLIDVSGGGYRYDQGPLRTTQLLANGKLYDITTAPANLTYSAVLTGTDYTVTDPKWGVTQTFSSVLGTLLAGAPARTVGKAAGGVTIDGTSVVLNGTLKGGTTAGVQQLVAGKLPAGGHLTVGVADNTRAFPYLLDSARIVDQVRMLDADFEADSTLDAAFLGTVELDARLVAPGAVQGDTLVTSGFSALSVGVNGALSVPAGVEVRTPTGGSLSFVANSFDVAGSLHAPSGSISLSAITGRSTIDVRRGAVISVAGGWVNDALAGASAYSIAPHVATGGAILLKSDYGVTLAEGSLLDASGGAVVGTNRKISAGNAGSITIQAGSGTGALFDGQLALDGELRGFSGSKGGTLDLTAPYIRIGGDPNAAGNVTRLAPELFQEGGFARHALTGYLGVSVESSLSPQTSSYVFDAIRAQTLATGADPRQAATVQLLPDHLRAPASLVLSSKTAQPTVAGDAGVFIAPGAVIRGDPGASVALSSSTAIEIAGRIVVPGGTVSATLAGELDGAIHVAGTGVISVPGGFVEQPNNLNLKLGKVIDAGTIALTSSGDIVLDPGSTLDVHGVATAIDVPVTANGLVTTYSRQLVGGDAGSIAMSVGGAATVAGALSGAPGRTGAAGGTFALTLNRGVTAADRPRRLLLSDDGAAQASDGFLDTQLSAARLSAGGFDALRVATIDVVELAGDLDLALTRAIELSTPDLRVSGEVELAAGTVRISGNSVDPANALQPLPVATRSGDGRLAVSANLIDLAGTVTINGASEVTLDSAGDIRLTGLLARLSPAATEDQKAVPDSLVGYLTTPGNVTLSAQRVYPTTLSQFTFNVASVDGGGAMSRLPGGTIRVTGKPGNTRAPLSAGGAVTLDADVVSQSGNLFAPLGRIELQGTTSVVLAPGSLTSTAAPSTVVPFGGTVDLQTWYYADIPLNGLQRSSVAIEAPSVTLQAGSVVDVSGGGAIQGAEWIPGIGGSRDVLADANVHAILPQAGLQFAPFDFDIAQRASTGGGHPVYDAVYLAGGGGLAAGYYALLPSYYALLPGAYKVRVQPTTAAVPGQTSVAADGATVVAGQFAVAGTGIRSASWTGFALEPGSVVQRQAEYKLVNASFLAAQALASGGAARMPADSGRISILAGNFLDFLGTVRGKAGAGGAGAELDLSAPKIAIVMQRGDSGVPADFVEIPATQFAGIQASVLIGGTRTDLGDGTGITPGTSEIRVRSGTQLSASDLMLAATGDIRIESGSTLSGSGATGATSSEVIHILGANGDGAFVRASATGSARLVRDGATARTSGQLVVEAGAQINAARSMILDATAGTSFAGEIRLADGADLALGAPRVVFGSSTSPGALTLGSGDLEQFAALGSLSLKSYTSIDVEGALSLGSNALRALTLDTPVIQGVQLAAGDTAALTARSITLRNTGTAVDTAPAGTGALVLHADTLVLDAGDKRIDGFDALRVEAGNVVLAGAGSLNVAGDIDVQTGAVTAQRGASQQVSAFADGRYRALALAGTPSQPSASAGGGALVLAANQITLSTLIDLPSGSLQLNALGADGAVSLLSGAQVRMSGYSSSFAKGSAAGPGGKLSISSGDGGVSMQAGAQVDLSGAAAGGDAGALHLVTSGAVMLEGTLRADATSSYRSGRFSLDAAQVGELSALGAVLDAGGFNESVSIRARGGNIDLGPGGVLRAHNVRLAADAGSVILAGSIDASSDAGGGRVQIDAMQDVRLLAGSTVSVRGTSHRSQAADRFSDAGEVFVAASSGTITFASGALIDASSEADGKSAGGQVWFSAPRTQTGVLADLQGEVKLDGYAQRDESGAVVRSGRRGMVIVEGARAYDNVPDVGAAMDPSGLIYSEYAQFMAAAPGIQTGISMQGVTAQDLQVRAGIELRNAGDMQLATPLDLTDGAWMLGGMPGRLTLRSAGTLTIQSTLGLPGDAPSNVAGWDIRLIGGADLGAASPLAVAPLAALQGTGDVVIANSAGGVGKVRTTTGSIDIAAGRNLVIQDPPGAAPTAAGDAILTASAASVYTTGVTSSPSTSQAPFADGGGDIRVEVQGDVVGAARQAQWINDWLRRTTQARRGQIAGIPASWWVEPSAFRHNIGTLGGGDVEISAGGSITNLSVMLPTSGRGFVDTDGKAAVTVTGGGDLTIAAGRDIAGGQYLLGRGTGTISAARDIGTAADGVGLYLMGASSHAGADVAATLGDNPDAGLAGADLNVVAGGDLFVTNISNPTLLALSNTTGSGAGFQSFRSLFLTYDDKSSASVLSVAGDVAMNGFIPGVLSRQRNLPAIGTTGSEILPPQVELVALQGSVTGQQTTPTANPLLIASSPRNALRILAAHDIGNLSIIATDADPAFQSAWDWSKPFEVISQSTLGTSSFPRGSLVLNRHVSPGPSGTYDFQVVAADGSISDSVFSFPRQAIVAAGQDLRDVRLDLQNLSATDVTQVRAGRDIKYVPQFLSGAQDVNYAGGYIRQGGPGRLLVQAGRNVDLGTSEGITAGGDSYNFSLPSPKSAHVTLVAGYSGDVQFPKVDALFADLESAGLEQDAALGEQAVARTFDPSGVSTGDLTMYFSAIRTQGDSGIDILLPGGNANAGLPVAGSGASTSIGIYTTLGGEIRTYTRGDFNVNQSKVLTMQGGDILMYSLEGNIDAGRGARDSRSTQPPRRVAILDAQGNDTGLRTFIPPVDAAGSGIRTLTSDPDGPGPLQAPKPGDVYLFAPRGYIDAGEAGIASAGNVVVAALQILNTSNISAQGSTAGVPVVSTGVSASVAAASSSAASTTRASDQSLQSEPPAPAQKPFIPSFITVEVLGLGEDAERSDRSEKDPAR